VRRFLLWHPDTGDSEELVSSHFTLRAVVKARLRYEKANACLGETYIYAVRIGQIHVTPRALGPERERVDAIRLERAGLGRGNWVQP
jgi:hypothetical protein